MKTLYKNFLLLDGRKKMNLLANQYLLVEDGKISKISSDPLPCDNEIDCNGCYLLPGLINCHVHLPSSGKLKNPANAKKLVKILLSNNLFKQIGVKICYKNAKLYLKSGVTTIRAVGGIGNVDSLVKTKLNRKNNGPRLLVSNFALAPKDGHMLGTVSILVNNNEEVKNAIDTLVAQNVDYIKLMITGGVLDGTTVGSAGTLKMAPELVKYACEYAHLKGVKTSAHVEGKEGMEAAILGGVDTIEHGAPFNDELAKVMKKHHQGIVLTISPATCADKLLPKEKQSSDLVHQNTDIIRQRMIESAKFALKNSIPVGLGTDAGCPGVTHYDTYRELIYLQKYLDLKPSEILYIATLGSAKLLGIDHLTGSIEEGKSADFVLLEDNPLVSFYAFKNIKAVVYNGKLFKKLKIKKDPVIEEMLDKFGGYSL